MVFGFSAFGLAVVILGFIEHRVTFVDIRFMVKGNGFIPQGLMRSPVTGSDGNVEFLVWLRRVGEDGVGETAVTQALTPPSPPN